MVGLGREYGSPAEGAPKIMGRPSCLSHRHLVPALAAQLSSLTLDDATIERVVRYVTQPAPPADELRLRRIRRQRQEIALAHAAGDLDDAEYLAAVGRLRDQERAASAPPPAAVGREPPKAEHRC